jgi:hypothetical protein
MSSLTAFSLSGRFSAIVAIWSLHAYSTSWSDIGRSSVFPARPIVHYQGRTSSHLL